MHWLPIRIIDIMRKSILLSVFLLLENFIIAQFPGQMPPPNDFCAKAIQIEPNERLIGHTNADASPSLEFERPAVADLTCIQTIENDVWFRFKADAAHTGYEIIITAGFCSTPAGLQALLIQSEGCRATEFTYRACSNKINTDTIKLYLEDPIPNQNYFIWIDGYDGTVCEFDVTLKARTALVPRDYRFLRFDYDFSAHPEYQADALSTSFENNAANFSWMASNRDDASLFIVELIPSIEKEHEKSAYGRVVGFVDPRNLVGDGTATYRFTDYITPYQNGETYYYRIVKVAGDGSKEVTATFAIRAKLVESFFLGKIEPKSEAGIYRVTYINRKKNQNFDVSVEDLEGNQIKSMQLLKEPVRDGEISINMQEFEPGEYFFIMTNGKDEYKKRFIHLGK